MTYEGTVKNGVVVFKAEPPPEGTEVSVTPAPVPPPDDAPPTSEDAEAFWDELMKFAGKAQGLPPDMAERHDYYRRERQKR
jgi:hypothetical protein